MKIKFGKFFLVFLLLFINIIFFSFQDALKDKISSMQSTYNINAVLHCTYDLKKKYNTSLNNSFDICAKKVRTLSSNGDMFVMEKDNKRIVWDASSDCKLDPSKSYLEKGYICDLFYKPNTCEYGSNILSKQDVGSFEWQFLKNSKEKINFKTFKWNNKKYVLGSGVIESDFGQNFLFIDLIVILIDVLFLITLRKEDE